MSDPRKVFVIHGRNAKALEAVKDLLRAVGLQALEWEQAMALTGKANAYIWEIVETGFAACKTAVAVLTGDEEVRLRAKFASDHDPADDRDFGVQARPNVLLEMGAAMARGPVVIVQIGPHRSISDIQGMQILRMDNTPRRRKDFVDRMKRIGAGADDSGADFLEVGDFDGAVVPYEGPGVLAPGNEPPHDDDGYSLQRRDQLADRQRDVDRQRLRPLSQAVDRLEPLVRKVKEMIDSAETEAGGLGPFLRNRRVRAGELSVEWALDHDHDSRQSALRDVAEWLYDHAPVLEDLGLADELGGRLSSLRERLARAHKDDDSEAYRTAMVELFDIVKPLRTDLHRRFRLK